MPGSQISGGTMMHSPGAEPIASPPACGVTPSSPDTFLEATMVVREESGCLLPSHLIPPPCGRARPPG